MCFWLVPILFRPLPNFKSPAFLGNLLVTHTFLMNFLISLKLLRAWGASIPWGMLHGLLYHSAVFICSACPSFFSAWSFYVRKPRDSLLTDEGSADLGPLGGWVTAGWNSCVHHRALVLCIVTLFYIFILSKRSTIIIIYKKNFGTVWRSSNLLKRTDFFPPNNFSQIWIFIKS